VHRGTPQEYGGDTMLPRIGRCNRTRRCRRRATGGRGSIGSLADASLRYSIQTFNAAAAAVIGLQLATAPNSFVDRSRRNNPEAIFRVERMRAETIRDQHGAVQISSAV